MPSIWSRLMAGVTAFREGYVTSGYNEDEEFESYAGRLARYKILWAMYENTHFRDIHTWAKGYRKAYGLYKYVRNIYSPAYRLTEFWKVMLWGGLLDKDAKDKGAIPIQTEDSKLRSSIASLWAASAWTQNKDIVTMFSSALGDVGIKIVDDIDKQQVRLEVIHPSKISDLILDSRGFVRMYELTETRVFNGRNVEFTEKAWRDENKGSTAVHYETHKDGKLHPWNGIAAEWTEEYGFIPFLTIKHIDIGALFGWAEIHPLRSKANEVDDLGAKLHDYIRKVVDPIWLFNFKKPSLPKTKVANTSAEPTAARPFPGREEMPSMYVNDSAAKGQALVSDELNIEFVSAEIQNTIAEMERDLPELQMDIWSVGGYTTGTALRTARQRVERKVIQRRPNYDEKLVQAHQMAIAIGGFRKYKGYEGFNLDSFKDGKLDHHIPTERPIFVTDASDLMTQKIKTWEAISELLTTGNIPIEVMLKDFGWSQEDITTFITSVPQQVVDDEDLEDQNSETDVEEDDNEVDE